MRQEPKPSRSLAGEQHIASEANNTPKSLESRLLSKFLSVVAVTPKNQLSGISELLTVCADEDEQGPTSWLDFVAPSELIPQVDPALNPNEVAVAAPSRGNYTTLSRGNQKTLHLVMYCRRHRAKVRMRVRRDDMWMRSCALCKAFLRKHRLCDSVRCQCGWTW
jgi:hypothetical protein